MRFFRDGGAGNDRTGDGKDAGDAGNNSGWENAARDAWRPPPPSKTLLEKTSDFVSHLSIESLPALSTNLLKRVTGKNDSTEPTKETADESQDKPKRHIYNSVEIEALAENGDPVAEDAMKMLKKAGDNKDWRTIIKEAYTNVVTQFKNFFSGDNQLQEVPQVATGSLDAVNKTRFQAKIQEDLKSTSSKSPAELLAESNHTVDPEDPENASDTLPAINPEKAQGSEYQLEGHISKVAHVQDKPIGWLEAAQKIAELPVDKQLQVIGAGLFAGFNEYNRQHRERSIGALIGTVQGVGTIATNLGKVADFSAYLLLNDHERARELGAEFGTALGETIVGGVRLFEGAHHYLNDVGKAGYEGDYTKVFRDIDNLGKHLDKAWSELPPREQSRIISKLGTELAADGLVGLGTAKAAGKLPGQFTKILDTISNDAQRIHTTGIKLSERSIKAIEEAVDPLVDKITDKLHMPEVPENLRHLKLQKATPELLERIKTKGREILFAPEGSEEMQYLKFIEAEANSGGPNCEHLLLKENPNKIAALEEFLHGTQSKLGLFDRDMPRLVGEVRVKEFMLRHARMLGLTENDMTVVEALREMEIRKALRAGYVPYEIWEKRW